MNKIISSFFGFILFFGFIDAQNNSVPLTEKEIESATSNASEAFYSSKYQSEDVLRSGLSGEVSSTIKELSNNFFIGLSPENKNIEFKFLAYSIYVNNNKLYVFEYGEYKGMYGNLNVGDHIFIKRVVNGDGSAQIKYFKNALVVREVATNPKYTLQIELYKVGEGQNIELESDFQREITATAFIKNIGELENTGIIDVNVVGGKPPYTYSWKGIEGATTQYLNNLSAGTYTVTITDSGASLKEYTFAINYKVMAYASPAFVNDGNGKLVKHAESKFDEEVMVATKAFNIQEKNYTEVSFEGETMSFGIGLDSDKEDISGRNLDLGVICNENNLYFINEGKVISSLGEYKSGDKLIIYTVENNLVVNLNGQDLYKTSLNRQATLLYPKAGFAKGTKLNYWIGSKFWKPDGESEAYATLTKKLDAGYYTMLNDIKYKYKEKYNDDYVNYVVYDWKRTPKITNVQPEMGHHYGVGYHRIKNAHTYLNDGEFYTMEITNDKGETYKMRFKFEKKIVSPSPIVLPPIFTGPITIKPCPTLTIDCYTNPPVVTHPNINGPILIEPINFVLLNIKGE